MKNANVLLVSMLMIGLLAACSGEKEPTIDLQNLEDAVQEYSETIEKAVKEQEEAVANGEGEAMHYSELQKYLPEEIDGYTADDPEGSTAKSMGFNLSTASRSYRKSNDDGSASKVDIKLIDYRSAAMAWTAATAAFAFGMGMEVDNSKEYQRTFSDDDGKIKGLEEFKKKSGKSRVVYALGNRFWLEVEATDQTSNDFVKELAESMELNELAEM